MTTVLLCVVGLVVAELSARGRRHWQRVSEQSNYLAESRQDGNVVLAGRRWPELPGRVADLPIEYGSLSFAILAGAGTRRES